MKIGMNMLLWTNHVTEQHYPIIDKIKEAGFDGIELPLGDGDIAHYASLGSHFSSMEIEATAVTSLAPETNIASPDPTIREAGLEQLKWAIDVAHAADIKVICGPFHSAFAYFTRQPPTLEEKQWSVEMLQKAGEHAAMAEITLAVEALNRFECYLVNTMSGLKGLLDQVNHPNVGAIFDTHHANIEEKHQKDGIHTIAPHLKHVHISENDRGTPGKGHVDWDEAFKALKDVGYNGWLTIEAFSTIIPEFANAINVWRDYSPAEEVYKEGISFIKEKWNSV